jgi:SulP family sulfate permease
MTAPHASTAKVSPDETILLHSSHPTAFRQALPSIGTGLTVGLLAIILAISFASLIFSGDLSVYLLNGIGAALIGGLALGAGVALLSSFKSMVAMPQDSVAAIVGLMAAAIAAHLTAIGNVDQILPTVMAALAVTAILVGVLFVSIGTFHLGNLIRFIPYPVIGGFLAGTGWLIVRGSFSVMTGVQLDLMRLPFFLQPDVLMRWLPGLVLALTLSIGSRRLRHPATMPSILAIGVLIFYVVMGLSGTSIAQAGANGLLLGPFPDRGLWPPLNYADLARVNWSIVFEQSGDFIAIMIVATISLLLNATGIELATQRELDLDRELKAAGFANLVAGAGFGLAGYHGLGLSVLANRSGSNSRLVGLVSAAMCGALLLFGASVLTYIPKVIVGGMLLYIGLDFFLYEWVVVTWSKLPRLDYALIILILIVIGVAGFLQGVAFGVVIAVVLFVVNYSRTNMVRHQLSGANHQSTVDRPVSHRRVLMEKGNQVYILELQGYLFFGTANNLLKIVRHRITDSDLPRVRFVLLDFRLVNGIDSSAAKSFATLRQSIEAQNITLIFTHLSAETRRQLKSAGFAEDRTETYRMLPNLDYGVEWCEDQILHAAHLSAGQPQPLAKQLIEILPHSIDIDGLMAYFEKLQVPAGEVIIQQGAPSNELYVIESGRLSAMLKMDDGEIVRLRTSGGGAVIGELGLYLNVPRTTSVVVEEPSTLYRLTGDSLARMESAAPDLAAAFHEYVARLLAERLVNTNNRVEALLQ